MPNDSGQAVEPLDGEVTPRQFTPERIGRADVQALLRRVRTLRDDQYTRRYPQETPCQVVIEFDDGHQVSREQSDWAGFFKRPLDWAQVRAKFDGLSEPHADRSLRDRIAETVADLEHQPLRDLTQLLSAVASMKR